MQRKFGRVTGAVLGVIVGILTSAAGALTVRAADAELRWQAPESIRAAARDAVLQERGESNQAQVEAVAVDDRLRLPACAAPLQALIERPIRRGQGTVTVSCDTPEPWRLFVPVRVTEQVAVLVTRRNVQGGAVLSAADIEVRTQNAASLPYNYLSHPDEAVGLVVRRTQQAGTVLAPGALDRQEVVTRGALVTLVSSSGGVTVKSEGIALEPATLHQRVRVRSASGRVVEGTAEGPSEVRVGVLVK